MNSHDLADAYRYCFWITTRHYENFPVASWLLPRKERPHVSAVYAFARSADDFADEEKYQGRSLELIEQWRKALWNCAQEQPLQSNGDLTSHPIFLALANTIRQCRLSIQLLDDLLTAFVMDVTKRRYANWEELMTYCRHSANPVGRLVLTIFGIREESLQTLSDKICTGLQLANHWQDLSRDIQRGICYVPEELMKRHGVSIDVLEKMVEQPLTPAVGNLLKELVTRARSFFDEGVPLIDQVQGRLRLELKLTLLGGRSILDQIEKNDYDVFRHRPVLSTWSKVRLLTHAVVS